MSLSRSTALTSGSASTLTSVTSMEKRVSSPPMSPLISFADRSMQGEERGWVGGREWGRGAEREGGREGGRG